MGSRFGIIALCLGIGLTTEAWGQTAANVPPKSVVAPDASVDIEQMQSRRSVLFQRMLDKPDDLDAAFEYAALSVQVGDLEAAVSTLERMLIFAPGLPRLQLELGVLYFRLAAYETARSYFEGAIASPDVPEEVRDKVQQYLDGIDTANLTTRFTGQVRAGVRYQTNANRSPTDSTVILNGLPFVLDADAQGKPDGNVYGAAAFHLSHNLPSQGDTIEADFVAYGSKQFSVDELDNALAELTVGPAFDLARFGIENGAAGVYGIGSLVFVDGNFYSTAAGAGVRLVLRPSPGFSWINAVEYRQRFYDNSESAPTAEDRDGGEIRAFSSVTYVINPMLLLNASGYVQGVGAEQDYLAFFEAGFAASIGISFNAPFGLRTAPWIFSPTAGYVYREFDGPDPIISTTETEVDHEAFVGANLIMPIKNEWALMAETEYRNASSNYTTRDYDNFAVSLAVVKSF